MIRTIRFLILFSFVQKTFVTATTTSLPYFPGVQDEGIILKNGGLTGAQPCPNDCDIYGARDTFVWYESTDAQYPYKMTYDGSGPTAWLACLAVSNDPTLRTWIKKGTLLTLGSPGEVDSASASYLTTYYDTSYSQPWIGYYLATNQTSPPPGRVPIAPYYTMLATAPTASGPYTKYENYGNIIPSGSPGIVMKNPSNSSEYWQFCTGCANAAIGLTKTTNLTTPWTNVQGLIDDPVENTSLYFEEYNNLWFLFTNHVGPDAQGMAFDDSIWVYWSTNLTSWPPNQKAVVLNRTNVIEPSFQTGRVGLPSILRVPGNNTKLAMIYDGGGRRDDVSYNQNCSIALAWLTLPLVPPTAE
jgi:hypothetical protein